MSRVGEEAGLPVFAVDYRLMPHVTFADILDDARAAFDHLRGLGYRAEQIILAGDSAGGHLALSLAYDLHMEAPRTE
eukprot:scaffold65434_cov47-Prasinocladus_malaysianus.AAC.1